MNYKKIFKIIDKYDVVSFDIFDTLLVRMTPNPKTVFEIVEDAFCEKFSEKCFHKDRITAEEDARAKTKEEEITFKDIYQALQGYSVNEVEWLVNKEIEIEKQVLTVNPIIKPIYDYCKERKKRLVIQSDMYLSKKTIEEILHINNIEYDYLAVSADLSKTKRSGSMYINTLKTIKCSSKDMIHFGDSLKSDFLIPMKMGIKAIRIKKHYYPKMKLHNVDAAFFDKLINIKTARVKNVYESIGFRIMGPFYLGYSFWLKKELEKSGVKKVFFLSRDGYIMQKAFELINNSDIKDEYLYVSRNSLIVPALYYYSDYSRMLELTNISVLKYITVELFLKKIGLNPSDCINELRESKLNIDDEIVGSTILSNEKVKYLYSLLHDKVIKNSKKQVEELIGYLNEKDFSGKVAVVDIGWQGTMQKALTIITKAIGINVDIEGYYVGVKKSAIDFEKGKMHGYCFDPTKPDLENYIFAFGGLFEFFYSNSDGSVKEYQNNRPVLEVNEYKETEYLEAMKSVQQGGLKYMAEAIKYVGIYSKIDFYKYSLDKLIRFGTNPKLKDLKPFKRLYYSNINNYYMLPQHSILYYGMHLKQLKVDLNQSFWKVGFLKELFKMSLPYFKVYDYLKRK